MKKFLFGMSALLSVSLFLIGCEVEVPVDRWRDPQPGKDIQPQKVVKDDTNLSKALADPAFDVIEVRNDSNVTLSTVTEIPAGKTVLLRSGLTLATGGLTVKGVVRVGFDGVLSASATAKIAVADGGHVYVDAGTLSIDAETSVVGVDADGKPLVTGTVLGTKATIGGGTLKLTEAGTTVEAVTKLLGYVTSGTVDAAAVTAAAALAPSASIMAFKTAVSGKKALKVKANGAEATDATALVVPTGLHITVESAGDLSKVTSITTEKGSSLAAASATVQPASTTVTVRENSSVKLGTIATLGASSVASGGDLTAVVTAFASTPKQASLGVEARATVNGVTFPAATTVSALTAATALTIDKLDATANTIFDVGTSTVTVTGTLTIADNAKLAGTGKIIVTAGTITLGTDDGYTTTNTGVVPTAIREAKGKLVTDVKKFTPDTLVNLSTTFGGTTGIGSATLTDNSTAVAVAPTADGTATGKSVTLDTGTTLVVGTVTATGDTAVTGTDADDIKAATFTLSKATNDLAIKDSGAANSAGKYGVVTFSGLKLASGELVSPAVPAFSIGVKTIR
jgi:hypothetical protein